MKSTNVMNAQNVKCRRIKKNQKEQSERKKKLGKNEMILLKNTKKENVSITKLLPETRKDKSPV